MVQQPKEENSQKRGATKLTPQGMVMIIIGGIMAMFFIIQVFNRVILIDSDKTYRSMVSSGAQMSEIESYSGGTINESYYQKQGNYLEKQADFLMSIENNVGTTAVAVNLIGMMASAAMIVAGTRIKQ